MVAQAYETWTESDAGRKNAWRVAEEHGNAAALIDEIAAQIAERSLELRPIKRYMHRERTNGKNRLIGIESVKQQVCDYVAITALDDLLKAKIGFWQVAGVKGKGQVMAARAVLRWSNNGGYYVHMDVRKCYPSIKAGVVLKILKRHVKSDDVLYLCETLLATYGGGLEIGSFFSLRMSQLVLSYGYHAVEDMHKERRGKRVRLVEHQLWYADDIYLFSSDKRNLRMAARSLQKLLLQDYGLMVKPWKICRIGDGEPVDVVGFRVRPHHVTLRSSLFVRARRAFLRYARQRTLRMARRVVSYFGWFKHADTGDFCARNDIWRLLRIAKAHVSSAGRYTNECKNVCVC